MDRVIEEITIENRTVQVIQDLVPIEQIQLDRDNPRIKYRLSLEANKEKTHTEKELEKLVLDLPEVKYLRREIEHHGSLHERVILQEHGTKFKAVEGNCRTVCIRDLHVKNPN